jgi:hypothetical protein
MRWPATTDLDAAPAITYRDWTNPRTGEVVKVPEGIDPGFAYNPGQAFLAALAPAIGN